jgi:hypothetical protein
MAVLHIAERDRKKRAEERKKYGTDAAYPDVDAGDDVTLFGSYDDC